MTRKKLLKKITAIVLAIAIFTANVDLQALATTGPVIYNGDSFESINEAVADARENGEKDIYITITEDLHITEALEIKKEEAVHISALEESNCFVDTETDWETNSIKGASVFFIENGAGLTLSNVVIQGNPDISLGKYSAIINNGTLNFIHSKLTEYYSDSSAMQMNDASFNMDEMSEVSKCKNGIGGYSYGTPGVWMTGECHISGGAFLDNIRDNLRSEGGALHSEGTLYIEGTSFVGNKAGWGGAIYSRSIFAKDCTFQANKDIYRGGAIYIINPKKDVEIINSKFNGNGMVSELNSSSGAININAANKTVLFYGNTFSENIANSKAGNISALYISNGTAILKKAGEYQTVFGSITSEDNTFKNHNGSTVIGLDNQSKLIAEAGNFINNRSSDKGVIDNQGESELHHVHFSGNSSTGTNKKNETVPGAEAVYNEGTLKIYGDADIEDEIMLAENKYITVKEKLSYPIKVAIEEKITESFRPIAIYETENSDEDAYENIHHNMWNFLSVPQSEREKVVAQDNQIGFASKIFTQSLKCTDADGMDVSGVCFNVYKILSDNEKKYLGITGTTDENGKLLLDRLTAGDYLLQVRDLPEGYERNKENTYTFATDDSSDTLCIKIGKYNGAPEAKIVADKTTVETSEEILFSGSQSIDDQTGSDELEYKWDFGDGGSSSKKDVKHEYLIPGMYLVMLTVKDTQGRTNTSVIEINVKGIERTNKVTVHVKCTETGANLDYIDVYVLDEKEKSAHKLRNINGIAETNLLKNKKYYIYAEDPSFKYLPRETSLQMDEEDKEITLYMNKQNTVNGEVTATDMTYQEIKDAGINLKCDENSHIVKYELELSFWAYGQFNPKTVTTYKAHSQGGAIQTYTEDCDGVCVEHKGDMLYILLIDGTTKWLKDMFHVQLVLYNTSTNEFVKDCEASLNLPEGLELASMNSGIENTKTRTIEKIDKSEQTCLDWYVRGNENGEYQISASVKGKMTDGSNTTDSFEFENEFVCQNPLIVQSEGALGVTVEVKTLTKTGDEYPVRFIYTNTSSKPLHGLEFYIDKELQYSSERIFVAKGFVDNHVITVNNDGNEEVQEIQEGQLISKVDELAPGESFIVMYSTTIEFYSIRDGVVEPVEAILMSQAMKLLDGSSSQFAYTNFNVVSGTYDDSWNMDGMENKFRCSEHIYSTENAEPVDLLTGAFTCNYTDVLLKGRHDLSFERSYDSKNKKDQGLGVGWHTNYDYALTKRKDEQENDYFILTDLNGARTAFYPDGEIYRDGKMSGRELSIQEGYYLLKDGALKYTFNLKGQLTSIIESDGWKTSLNYTEDLLNTISSPAGTIKLNWEKTDYVAEEPEEREITEADITELDWSKKELVLEKAENHITSIEVNGKEISYNYEDFNLKTVTNLDHDSISFKYDDRNNITSIKDYEKIETVTNVYDYKCRVKKQTVTGEGTFHYTYDEKERKNTCTGENDYEVSLLYDEEGRIIKNNGADEEGYHYNGFGKIVRTEDSDGVLETAYDANGNIAKIVYPDKTSEEYHYNENNLLTYYKNRNDDEEYYHYSAKGLLEERIDANENKIRYEYDNDGNISKEISGENCVTNYTYVTSGQIATKTDPKGNITYYHYDSFGRLKSEGISGEKKKQYEYSTAGKLKKYIDEKGNTIEYTVNKNGFTTETKDARKNTESTEYNAQSKVSTQTSKENYKTEYGFDARGNVNSEKDANGNEIRYTYDSYGNVKSKTDELNHKWKYLYDRKNRLKQVTDPYNHVETYQYDSNGNMTEKTDINGTVYYEYDKVGNLTAEKDTLKYEKKYEYDKNGNLTKEIDANGNATLYKYDKDNRLESKETQAGKIKYTYDKNGNNIITKYIEILENGEDQVVSEEHFTYDYAGRVTTFVDANHSKDEIAQISYTYDDAGNLTDENKSDGGNIHYEYDENNNVTSITNERRIKESYTYDKQDRLTEVKDSADNVKQSYTYDCDDNVTFERNEENNSIQYTYDKAGRLKTKTLGTGEKESFVAKVTYSYEYDQLGRITKEEATDADTERTVQLNSYVYDNRGNLSTVTSGSGTSTGKITYSYNSRGEVTEEVDAYGNTTKYRYDGNGNVSEKTEANGNVITYTYDCENRVIKQSDTCGRVYEWSYDLKGNLVKYTDAEKHVTEYQYDKNGNNTKVTDASGNYLSMTYDGMNRLSHKESNGKVSEDYTYDQAGNVFTQTDSNGTVTTYQYNDDNKPTKMTKSKGNQSYTEQYQYDQLNRLIKVTYEDGTFKSYTYDFQDKQTSYTDRKGNTTNYTYDGFGNLIQVTQVDGNYTKYVYDERNLLSKKTDHDVKSGKSEVTTYTYDGNGNVKEELRSANGKTITKKYTYDRMNNLSIVEDASSVLAEYHYDKSNHLTEKKEDGITTKYSYNKNGELTKMVSPDNTTSFTRDSLDRISEVQTNNRTIAYTYDADGNKERINYGDGKEVHYTYDGNGNITEERLGSKVTSFSYDYLNHRTSKQSRGVGEIYQYDQNQNLSKVYATEGIRSYLLDQYNYDENGNITYHKETGFYSGSPKETSYSYDDLNRLKTESVTKNNQTTSNMYAYDGFGNLTSEIRGTRFINYTYNGLNQLTNKTDSSAVGMAAFIGVNYSYDIHGNMTSVYDPGSVAGTTFAGTYNVNGQLETSKKNVNKGGLKDIQSTYTYDGLGNPVKEQSRSTYYSKQTNLTTEYIYDYTEEVPTVLSEIRSDGVTIDYTYGDSKERLEAVVTSTSVYNQSEKTYNISTDERGSSRWALDDVGNVKAKTSYDAWGNVTENTAISLSSYMDDINLTESFTGYIYDEGTKAWNAGARTYDPVTKRFLSEDPESGSTQEPISMVKYVYAYNNPVMNIDPDGRSVWGTITSWAGKTASAVKSFVGNTVNKASQAASYVKEKVSQGIENFRQAGREVLDTVAGYMQKVACMIPDGVKKVWHDATKLYEKIPTEAKFAIGLAGVAIATVTGALPATVALGTLAVGMASGAAINVGTYVAGSFFGYHDFSWKEMGKRAIDGAADGSLFAGIGLAAKGISYAIKNPEPLMNFLKDETGCLNPGKDPFGNSVVKEAVANEGGSGYHQDANGRWHRPNGQFASNGEMGIDTPVKTSTGIHGNSLSDPRTNYGYALVDKDTNEILKFGETLYPDSRYSQNFLDKNNAKMIIMEQGSKADIHYWQHDMNEYYFDKYDEYPPLNSKGW